MSVIGGLQLDGAVFGSLPVGVVVCDATSKVLAANQRAAEMMQITVEEMIGSSVLEFVHPDDLEFAIESFATGDRYRSVILGPMRLRYVDASGVARFTEFWARNCTDDPRIGGYVMVFTPESVTDLLAEAVRNIAAIGPLEQTVKTMLASLSAFPTNATAALLIIDGDRIRVEGAWALAEVPAPSTVAQLHERGDAPWSQAALTAEGVDVGAVADMPGWLQVAAEHAGVASVWTRPVVVGAEVAAVLVIWRVSENLPSPNQDRRLTDVSTMVALAFDQAEYHESMSRAIYTDPLTGLGNRARFMELVTQGGLELGGVLYVDLDDFKAVNDTLGHAVGDDVLKHAGARLARAVRADDEVLRVGGDEFVVVCPASAGLEDLTAMAERVVAVLSEPFSLIESLDHPAALVRIGASVGVSIAQEGSLLAEVVERADRAMYHAKQSGAARWRLDRDLLSTPVNDPDTERERRSS